MRPKSSHTGCAICVIGGRKKQKISDDIIPHLTMKAGVGSSTGKHAEWIGKENKNKERTALAGEAGLHDLLQGQTSRKTRQSGKRKGQ